MGVVNHPTTSVQHVHQRLGNVRLSTQPSKITPGQTVTTMTKVIPVRHQKQFLVWQESLNKIKNTQTLDVIFFPLNYQFQAAGMCGNTGVMTMVFQDYFFVLESEIRNREKQNKPFLETEVWYLLYNMIRGAKEYEKCNEKIGDMRPANVVINQDGQIKIVSVHTCPGELTNYQKAVQSRKENVYLAPEECREDYIKIAQYPGNVLKTAAEMFSIGVTLLQSMILKDCTLLYNKVPYSFNVQAYESYRNELRLTLYSEHLKQLVGKMLDLNPEVRPKASQVYINLNPFHNEILDLEQFRFPNYHIQTTQTQIVQPVSMYQQHQQIQPQSRMFVQPQITSHSLSNPTTFPEYRTTIQYQERSEGFGPQPPIQMQPVRRQY